MVCTCILLVAGLPSYFSVLRHKFLPQNYLGTRGLLYYRLLVMTRKAGLRLLLSINFFRTDVLLGLLYL